MFHVYVLKSLRDGGLYVGLTNNLERRVHQHNTGQARSTRNRRPFELVLSECFPDRQAARTKERFYKTGWGRERLETKLLRSR